MPVRSCGSPRFPSYSRSRFEIQFTGTNGCFLPLKDGQGAFVQLHNGQRHRAGVHRTDMSPASRARPTAVGTLAADQEVEGGFPVFAPGDPAAARFFREELAPALVAEDVKGLGVVILRVFIMPHPAAAHDRNGVAAILEPLLDVRAVVFT